MAKKEQKIEWITVLRAIACLAVVMIHAIHGWLDTVNISNVEQIRYWLNMIILAIVEFAVPCFIMISGCLLLNPKKNLTLETLKKYIIRMLLILATFGFFYAFIESYLNNGGQGILYLIGTSIMKLLTGNTWSHMWYIYMLIGLYLITPILRTCVNHFDMKTAKFVLFNFFVFSCLIPTINHMFYNVLFRRVYLCFFLSFWLLFN